MVTKHNFKSCWNILKLITLRGLMAPLFHGSWDVHRSRTIILERRNSKHEIRPNLRTYRIEKRHPKLPRDRKSALLEMKFVKQNCNGFSRLTRLLLDWYWTVIRMLKDWIRSSIRHFFSGRVITTSVASRLLHLEILLCWVTIQH